MSLDKTREERLQRLVEICAVDRTPEFLDEIYVEPVESAASRILRRSRALPRAVDHTLLMGGRGCGKSTELRRLHQRLSQNGEVQPILLDLDHARVNAADVTAFDLCYLMGLHLLGLLDAKARKAQESDAKKGETAYGRLSGAYFGDSDPDARPPMGQQLGALGAIADKVGALGVMVAGTAGAAPAVGLALGAGSLAAGLILRDRGRREVVHENSPAANAMLAAVTDLHDMARGQVKQPIVVLVDGLEKMNGESAERLRDVFERTLLLAKLPFSFVIGAPPSSMTKATSLADLGYQTVEVWSFTGRPDAVEEMVAKRISAAGLDPDEVLAPALRSKLAAFCGGHARTAMYLMREAVPEAIANGQASVGEAELEVARRIVGRRLNQALTGADRLLLAGIHAEGMDACRSEADEDRAGKLFANGQILAVPPRPGHTRTTFTVHPLVAAELPT